MIVIIQLSKVVKVTACYNMSKGRW